MRLARAYAQRGDKEHAIHYYELSLKVNPNNEWARKKLKEAGVDVGSATALMAVHPYRA